MRSLLMHWVFNAAALWVAAYFITGLDFTGTSCSSSWWPRSSGW